MNVKKFLTQYDYHFPKTQVALTPASPRDSANLLVYNRRTNTTAFDKFYNLPNYLPPPCVLVFNKTKVLPAKIMVTKETGGTATLLYLSHTANSLTVIADRKLPFHSKLFLTPQLSFTVQQQKAQYYALKPSFPLSQLFSVLQTHGCTPLPPYLKTSPLTEQQRKEKYQTVFARVPGSIAAPTASLHFTERLLKKLRHRGIQIEFITLHVNLGTFAPLTEEMIQTGKLHRESFTIDPKTLHRLQQAKKERRPIIAVGTTVVRVLESVSNLKGNLQKRSGVTNLFIREGYTFKFIDGMITNFHIPRSSLLMLVAAFTGRERLLALYHKAIQKNFCLFSFGDGMLIS